MGSYKGIGAMTVCGIRVRSSEYQATDSEYQATDSECQAMTVCGTEKGVEHTHPSCWDRGLGIVSAEPSDRGVQPRLHSSSAVLKSRSKTAATRPRGSGGDRDQAACVSGQLAMSSCLQHAGNIEAHQAIK